MKHNLPLGVTFALAGTFFYSAQTAVIKAYILAIPLPMLVFIQSLVGLMLFLPILFHRGMSHAQSMLKTPNFFSHILRAIFSLGVSYFLFLTVRYIPLVNAILLANIAPLLLPFVAYVLFGQRINHKLWLPIIVGFVGVVLVLHPDGQLFHPAAFWGVAAALCTAMAVIMVRKLSDADSTETIMFYFFFISTIISGLATIRFWQPLPLNIWLILAGVGAMYFTCQYLITLALRFANAQLVGSLLYMNIVYSAIIVALVWQTFPGMFTLSGMILTVFGGILCIRAEHQRQHAPIPVAEEAGYLEAEEV